MNFTKLISEFLNQLTLLTMYHDYITDQNYLPKPDFRILSDQKKKNAQVHVHLDTITTSGFKN